MKSARERAEAAAELGCVPHGVYRRNFVEKVALMFKEHARDQRHLCAEQCAGIESDDGGRIVSACHAAVMDSPSPGE